MDAIQEKKWFVYLSDHHEGPFALEEVRQRMGQGQITAQNFVWCDGMGDWLPMNQVPAFESVITGPAPMAAAPADSATMASTPILEPMLTPILEPVLEEVASEPSFKPMALEAAPAVTLVATGSTAKSAFSGFNATKATSPSIANLELPTAQPVKRNNRSGRWIAMTFVLALIVAGVFGYWQGYFNQVLQTGVGQAVAQTASDFARPYLLSAIDKYPDLGKWISPIPALEDITSEDYEELRATAATPFARGARVAIALSKSDQSQPLFYVASNLPENAVFDVYVEGVPDTLLNQTSFSARAQATLVHRLGRTGTVHYPDGKKIPRGQYTLYIVEAPFQVDAVKAALVDLKDVLPAAKSGVLPSAMPKQPKIFVTKTFFLGGAKDSTYSARLKEFHDKLKEKASTELAEIKQMTATLESQMASSATKFASLQPSKKKKKITSGQKRAWENFHGQWVKMDEQLGQSLKKVTPDALQNEYFYGMIYQLVQQAAQSIERVHGFQNTLFTGTVDAKSFEIQLGEATSQASGVLSQLKAKIDQAEKIPLSPNGMPLKEGL